MYHTPTLFVTLLDYYDSFRHWTSTIPFIGVLHHYYSCITLQLFSSLDYYTLTILIPHARCLRHWNIIRIFLHSYLCITLAFSSSFDYYPIDYSAFTLALFSLLDYYYTISILVSHSRWYRHWTITPFLFVYHTRVVIVIRLTVVTAASSELRRSAT